MFTLGQVTPKAQVGTSYFLFLCTGHMCISNTLQNWNATMRRSRCKRPIESCRSYSPANKISSSVLPCSDLSESGTMIPCHLLWEVTCKLLMYLLKSLTLDLPFSSDPITPTFPVKNLLSDTSYHSLVARRLLKLNVSTSFTISS